MCPVNIRSQFYIFNTVLQIFKVPISAARCSLWVIISILSLFKGIFPRLVANDLQTAPHAPIVIMTVENLYPWYILWSSEMSGIYFISFLSARFVSKGTVHSTSLHVFYSFFHSMISDLLCFTLVVV